MIIIVGIAGVVCLQVPDILNRVKTNPDLVIQQQQSRYIKPKKPLVIVCFNQCMYLGVLLKEVGNMEVTLVNNEFVVFS